MKEVKSKKIDRLYEERYNNQGCLMKIVEYNNTCNIVVEFQDEYKTRVHSDYRFFSLGKVRNPYHPEVCGVGIVGNKYPAKANGKNIREYVLWKGMICRCFDNKYKEQHSTYQSANCCNEWLLYENFYDWLHSQNGFNKLTKDNDAWNLDKDILTKGNKLYSPETCCLVPKRVNLLFTKNDINRGDLPIGVSYHKRIGKFHAKISKYDGSKKYREHIGYYDTPEQAFQAYKTAKEKYIKQVAQEEYDRGNITEKCYDAMMKYKVEITD